MNKRSFKFYVLLMALTHMISLVSNAQVSVVSSATAYFGTGMDAMVFPDFFVTAGSNRKLVVMFNGESAENPTNVTYGAQSLTKVADTGTSRIGEIWYLDDPAVGAADVTISWSGNARARGIVLSLQNATPGVDAAVGGIQSTNITLTTTDSNAFVLGSFTQNSGGQIGDPKPFSTQLYIGDSGSSHSYGGYQTEAVSGVKSYDFIPTTSSYGAVAVAFGSEAAVALAAVDYGGDYTGSNQNTLSGDPDPLTEEIENVDFSGGVDRRADRTIDSLFGEIDNSNGLTSKNRRVFAGLQIANLENATDDPTFGLFRFSGSGTNDLIQVTSGAGTANMAMAFAPYFVKSDFLNGFDSQAALLSFCDASDSITVDLAQLDGGGAFRALVKNGQQWYVSASSASSASTLIINGLTETWYPCDPSANLFVDEANLPAGIPGSSLKNIQAIGAFVQSLSFDGTNANAFNVQVEHITAKLNQTPFISVGDYSGTANERIDAAIAAAAATDHKTVFFPNGTYALRSTIQLSQGANTELHLIGESRDGVFLIPDVPYLEANYNGGDWANGGARLGGGINLQGGLFDTLDVSIQGMTIDMRDQRVMGESPTTYNNIGHGLRIGQGWTTGQYMVNQVTIRNVQGYGIGIQNRDGQPKNNITLTNLHIERTGSDGIDTKEAGGDGNRNLVIRNISINEIGFIDPGAAPMLDLRYRDVTIENANIVSRASHSTAAGQNSSVTGINFRQWNNGPGTGIVGATVSNVYVRGTNVGMRIHASDITPHANVAISDFRIQGQTNVGIDILGTEHSGHTISDGFVDPAFGGAAVNANGQAIVSNITAGRWDPLLTPVTDTTFESNVSLANETFSPAWVGMVGPERVSLNPTAPSSGPFVFDVGGTGVMQIDFDGVYNAMDKLIVEGTLNLGGELRINMIDGAPSTAGTYRIFKADAITGSFDTITLPAAPGMTWVTDNLATDGTISLFMTILINTLSPADNATDIFGADNLVATFNKPVQAGTGSIVLKRSDDDSTVETFDVTTDVVFNGSEITIDPASTLEPGTGYYVTINATAVEDLSGNAFDGLSGNTAWSFTTVEANAIIPVNTGSGIVASSVVNPSVSFSFDAGADADMLMVAVSTEHSSEAIPTLSYGGHALTLAIEEMQAGIWYLDLTAVHYQGGAAPLVIDFTGINKVNGVAMGAVSVRAQGRNIELHATALGTTSADLLTTRSDAFVLASFNANTSGSPSVDAPLTTIYASGNIGSAQGAAGYEASVAAGNHPINWTTGNKRRVAVAAFVVIDRFADWIVDYDLGTATGLSDDPDGDRLLNGIEAWFGSNPGEFSPSLVNLALVGPNLTFTHPVSSSMLDDLEGFYQWSMNLVDWYACDGLEGPVTGESVSLSSQVDIGVVTVTLSPSESMPKLFVRAAVRVVE